MYIHNSKYTRYTHVAIRRNVRRILQRKVEIKDLLTERPTSKETEEKKMEHKTARNEQSGGDGATRKSD